MNDRTSTPGAKAAILSDLKAAYRDTEKWKQRSDPSSSDAARTIQSWRVLNLLASDDELKS